MNEFSDMKTVIKWILKWGKFSLMAISFYNFKDIQNFVFQSINPEICNSRCIQVIILTRNFFTLLPMIFLSFHFVEFWWFHCLILFKWLVLTFSFFFFNLVSFLLLHYSLNLVSDLFFLMESINLFWKIILHFLSFLIHVFIAIQCLQLNSSISCIQN